MAREAAPGSLLWLIWKFYRRFLQVEREFVDRTFRVVQVQNLHRKFSEVVYRQAGDEGVENICGDMNGPVKYFFLSLFGPGMAHGFHILAPIVSGNVGREKIELYRLKLAAIGLAIRIVADDCPHDHEVVHFSVGLISFFPWNGEAIYPEAIIPPPTVYRAVEAVIGLFFVGLFSPSHPR